MRYPKTDEEWKLLNASQLRNIISVADRQNNYAAKEMAELILGKMRVSRAKERALNGIVAVHAANNTAQKTMFSWGSVRPSDGVIFLNVWTDEIEGDWVNIFRLDAADQANQNYRERITHCDSVLLGAKAFVIVCEPVFDKHNKRSMKTLPVDQYLVLPIKAVERRNDNKEIWARIKD